MAQLAERQPSTQHGGEEERKNSREKSLWGSEGSRLRMQPRESNDNNRHYGGGTRP